MEVFDLEATTRRALETHVFHCSKPAPVISIADKMASLFCYLKIQNAQSASNNFPSHWKELIDEHDYTILQ